MSQEQRLISAVHDLTRALAASAGGDDQLASALRIAIGAVGAEAGSVLLHEPDQRELSFRLALGSRGGDAQPHVNLGLLSATIRDDEGIAGQVFQTGKPLVVNAAGEHASHSSKIDDEIQFSTRSLVTVPIAFPGGEVVGVIQLVNKQSGDFDEADLALLSVLSSITALSVALRSERTTTAA